MFVVGGSDVSQHTSQMVFAKLLITGRGFYGVETLGIALSTWDHYAAGFATEVDVSNSVYNQGEGLIVDSGTTDIYLPKGCAAAFKAAWASLVPSWDYDMDGTVYLTPQQLKNFPTVHVRVRAEDGASEMVVDIPPVSYMEKTHFSCTGRCEYLPRIFLDEPRGGVLGGPFFAGHDVQFDVDDRRLGVAKATCANPVVDARCDDSCEYAFDGECNDFVEYDDEYYYDGYYRCAAGTDCTDCCVANDVQNCTAPTRMPTDLPAPAPTAHPTFSPQPSVPPTAQPSAAPSPLPSSGPTVTPAPTTGPTVSPTPEPTPRPTPRPTPQPSYTHSPTPRPSPRPSPLPTPRPSYRLHPIHINDEDGRDADDYRAASMSKNKIALLAIAASGVGMVLFFVLLFGCRGNPDETVGPRETELVDRGGGGSPERRRQKYSRAPGAGVDAAARGPGFTADTVGASARTSRTATATTTTTTASRTPCSVVPRTGPRRRRRRSPRPPTPTTTRRRASSQRRPRPSTTTTTTAPSSSRTRPPPPFDSLESRSLLLDSKPPLPRAGGHLASEARISASSSSS